MAGTLALVLGTTVGLIAAYYGRAPRYSYFAGCSGGGRQALVASQRFGGEYDGVLAGVPILEQHVAQTGSMQILQEFTAIAPRGADGKPVLSRAFSDADLRLIVDRTGRISIPRIGSVTVAGLPLVEVGGAIDPGSDAHDLVMSLYGGMSKGERNRIKTRVRSAMAYAADPSRSKYEVFNLGNNRTIGLLEMIRLMEKVLNVDARIDWQDWQPGEMRRTWADISKPHALLGYEPATDFETGLRRFADWLAVQP